ncbi:MAG: SCO family protein [Burkholderiales bacterium]
MNKRHALKALFLPGITVVAAQLAACSPQPPPKPQFKSIDVTGAPYANDFALIDHNGMPRSMADFAGKAVLIFFGFTQCPDVCPTTLVEAQQVRQLLGADAARLQVLFVTLDPERDSQAVLKAYMANFDPSFLALYTTPEKLAVLAKDYKVYYKKVEGKTPTSYTLDHSAGSYVYDPQGRVRLYTRYGSGAANLAADIGFLLKAV